jgi:hypothetical protein
MSVSNVTALRSARKNKHVLGIDGKHGLQDDGKGKEIWFNGTSTQKGRRGNSDDGCDAVQRWLRLPCIIYNYEKGNIQKILFWVYGASSTSCPVIVRSASTRIHTPNYRTRAGGDALPIDPRSIHTVLL